MLHNGRTRHPGRVSGKGPQGRLSDEFVREGGRKCNRDLELDSGAQFLAVAEHRLIPARARSIGHQLRKAGRQSVWALACQDQISGCHAVVGVIRLHGAPLSAPSLVTLSSGSGDMRATIPSGDGGVVHLFVVYGYQGLGEYSGKLQLADKLHDAVLAEAQVEQLMLAVGDFNADPSISLPCQ